MLLLIILYILVTIIVGLAASRLVRSTEDYLLAGRRLPVYMATATLFATWFGSETILGASAEFAGGGLIAVVRDPFGAALCLFLVALFFARPLYRMRLLTLGDFYRRRYGPATELIAGVAMVMTYLAWIAAQLVAFGIIINALTGMPVLQGILISALVVSLYTFIGGMWSVTVTDFMQLIFIIVGLAAASLEVFGVISLRTVFQQAPEGFFRFVPEPGAVDIMNYAAAWITIGLGSIAGQDIFQRVMASRSEKVAVRSAFLAGFMYLTVAMVPLLLALAARALMPHYLEAHTDTQFLIPALIMEHTSPLIQVLLFGALLSAILSTASSALLAPAAILGENLVRPRLREVTDRQMLWISRLSVLAVAGIATWMAVLRGNIYELVGEAASVGLVSLFVPLVGGLAWRGTTQAAAITSMISGLLVWLFASWLDPVVEPILFGLGASVVGLAAGQAVSRKIKKNSPPDRVKGM